MRSDEEVVARAAEYGAVMTGEQVSWTKEELEEIRAGGTLAWDDPRLKRVTRLRLVSDVGFPVWDVSYCMGERRDGTPCRVQLPFDQLPKRGWKREIVRWARADGVWAKGLGIFDVVSTLQ